MMTVPFFRAMLLVGVCLTGASASHAQTGAPSSATWNGERRAMSTAERYGPYFSVGSITCRKPGRNGQPDTYFHGTGQVTLAQDVVTTAAHNFLSPACKPYGDEWTCRFYTETGGFDIDLARSKFGASLDPKDWRHEAPGRCKSDRSDFVKDDWAVLKLTRPIKDAVPFRVDDLEASEVRATGGSVTMLAGHTPAFLRDGKQTNSVERCRHLGASPRGGSAGLPLLIANCGGGPGTSGSGLYRSDPQGPGFERLIAIYHGPLLLPGRRVALYVPIRGEFLTQLRAAASR